MTPWSARRQDAGSCSVPGSAHYALRRPGTPARVVSFARRAGVLRVLLFGFQGRYTHKREPDCFQGGSVSSSAQAARPSSGSIRQSNPRCRKASAPTNREGSSESSSDERRRLQVPGISTSRVEVVQLTPVGLWLAWRDIELYLDHDRFPWFRCCVLLDQRHYLREAGAGKGSCQPAVECGQPSAACGRQRCKVKVGDLSSKRSLMVRSRAVRSATSSGQNECPPNRRTAADAPRPPWEWPGGGIEHSRSPWH